MVPVHKIVKESSVTINYHPFCLLSIVGKIFEKLDNDNRVVSHHKKYSFFSNFQYGSGLLVQL